VKSYDAVIVGGGIIGGSIAFELAQHGLRVALLDRQQPGLEASWAAAGMLVPGPESPESAALVPLARESFALYPAYVAAVEEASGKTVEFRIGATLHVFGGVHAEQTPEAIPALLAQHGVPAKALTPEEARRLEPGLNPNAKSVLLLREEGRVDARSLTAAVLSAASQKGVEILAETSVEALVIEKKHCVGVTAHGEKMPAGRVVLAAGCYCETIAGAEGYAPTRPVRGQMIALRPAEGRIRHVLRGEHGYLVPREDGRVLAGSTSEDAGFEKRVTPGGLQQILRAAVELVPRLESAAVVETWSGLRPDTPDHLPILGPTDIDGLLVATGHYRNGILLAPVTAKLVGEWMREEEPSLDARAFNPLRFLQKKMQAGG